MNKLLKRGLLAATAIAIPAGALLASPLAANAAPTSPAVTTQKGVVNNTGYSGTLTHTDILGTNTYRLHVKGEYGWTNDFVLKVQTPQGSHQSGVMVTGSVTDTTEYGSSTQVFSVDSAAWLAHPVVPFSADGNGHITVDPASQAGPTYAGDPAGTAMFGAEYQMVYHTPGAQNAGYWLGN